MPVIPRLIGSNPKRKLVSVTGIPIGSQLLILQHSQLDESQPRRLDEDGQQLGFYGVVDGMVLKVRRSA
jgi:hypothetical protein